MENSARGTSAVSDAFVLRLEVVAVATAASVGEQLATAQVLVEVEPGNVARTDSFVANK